MLFIYPSLAWWTCTWKALARYNNRVQSSTNFFCHTNGVVTNYYRSWLADSRNKTWRGFRIKWYPGGFWVHAVRHDDTIGRWIEIMRRKYLPNSCTSLTFISIVRTENTLSERGSRVTSSPSPRFLRINGLRDILQYMQSDGCFKIR